MMQLPPTNKLLGQHWLHDDASLDAMLDAAAIGPEDTVLEVGPGPGTLTAKLVHRAKRVVAVEFDAALARELPQRVPADNLEIIRQDILKFDLSTLPPGYKVSANIPYYLTSNLIRILCEAPNHLSQAALLVQKEVAERICAKPGDMSILSVAVQFYTDASLGRLVPAALFTPPPKVNSQVLQLAYHRTPRYEVAETKLFFRIVKAGFSQRRKTLLNSLSGGLQLSRDETSRLLGQAGIAPTTRAQNLNLDEWFSLYKAYNADKM
jgi:16S rRNA (adenine1518-N6/adenine1519-N6)-dimethyltransferase